MKFQLKRVPVNFKIIILSILLFLCILGLILYPKISNKSVHTVIQQKSTTEQALCRVLNSIEGVGKVEVMVVEAEDSVNSVIIVCEGADNIMLRSDILNAVSKALSIDKNKIGIYKMTK